MASLTFGTAALPCTKPQPRQILLDCGVQPPRLGLLLAPLLGETGHLLLEGLAVVLLRRCADVAAGGEDMAVLADFLNGGALAEAGDVGVGVLAGPITPPLGGPTAPPFLRGPITPPLRGSRLVGGP